MSESISNYLSRIGAKGGAAGTGAAKRRGKKHYQNAAKARWKSKKSVPKTT